MLQTPIYTDFVRTLNDSQPTGVSTFASHTSASTDQSLQKSHDLSKLQIVLYMYR